MTAVQLDGDLANCTWLLPSREGFLLKEAEYLRQQKYRSNWRTRCLQSNAALGLNTAWHKPWLMI